MSKEIIIDTHFHLGECRIFDLNVTEDVVLNYMKDYDVTAVILQPFPGAFPQPPVHIYERIVKLAEEHEGRIFGMVHTNPTVIAPDDWKRDVRKWIKDYGFVGIKVHPLGHAVNLFSKNAEMIFELANELEVPVMVHTGLGVPFASPTNVIPHAEKYPDLKIILAHAGFTFHAGEALLVASKYKNVYLETCASMPGDIAMFIEKLGADKVMFGTDIPQNIEMEFAKVRSLNLSKEDKEKFLYKTAEQVFKIKVKK